MNTSKEVMSLIFSTLKEKHLLQSDAMPNFIAPQNAKHGDLVVTMDPNVIAASGQATNHDPDHVPVALKLFHLMGSPEQGKAQCVRFCPQTTHPGRQEELEHVRSGHLRPAHYNNSASSCTPSEIVDDARLQDGYRPTSPCTATEHAEATLTSHPPAPDDDSVPPRVATEHAEAQQDHQPAISKPMTAKMTNKDDEVYAQRDQDALVTDDDFACQDDDKNADLLDSDAAERLYCSISLLMWSANLDNPEVEMIMRDCVRDRLINTSEVIHSMEEICYPFFFAERTDSTQWKPHDLCQIMRNLLWYDWFRKGVLDKHGLRATATLTISQCSECYQDYREWFEEYELRPDQSRDKTTSYISARMHQDVGNRFAVYSTWKFGLPAIDEPLRQACLQSAMLQSKLSHDNRLAVWNHVDQCINWCQLVAQDVRERKETERYKEEKRKSGSWKKTGLNDAELAARQNRLWENSWKKTGPMQQQLRKQRWSEMLQSAYTFPQEKR